MIETEGTVYDLYKLRQALRDAIRTMETMKDASLPYGELRDTVATLLETAVVLQVPCIICKETYPVSAEVGEDGLPEYVLCKRCDDEVNEELGIKKPPGVNQA